MTANDRLTGIAASLRLSLLGSTALVGSALLAGQAQAQTIPVVANAGGATVAPPVVAGDGSMTLGIDLTNRSRILDFVSYNVGANDTVSYTSSTGTTNLVAVNRVLSTGTGLNASTISGTISAGNGISVWLVNQDGITFNGRASLTGGSLMLSTLDFTSALDGLGNVDPTFRTTFGTTGNTGAFTFSGASTRPITIGSNLSIAGSIVAIGQNVTTGGTLTSTAGSVVLVAASDVTFSQGLGNPLSITVNAGTALGGAVNVNNNVSGQSVLVAGGLQGSLTAALLNVKDGTTLTASAAGGTVTLATATTTVGANTVSITNGATAAPSIALGGTLSATQAGSDVIVNSAANFTRTAAVAGAGTITAARNVTISAANDVTVAGSNYTATGGTLSVTAGRDATLGALTAGDDVTATTGRDATFGGAVDAGDRFAITVTRDATITGNVDAGGNVGLQILGTTTIDGDIGAGGTFDLTRTTALSQTGDIVANGASNLIVGSGGINATGLNESTTADLTINTTGSATLGALTAANTVSVDASGFATLNGAIGAGDLIVSSGADTTINGDATVDTDTTLTVGGDTIVNGDVATGNDFLVDTTQNYTQSGDVVAGRNADLTVSVGASVTGLLEGTAGFVHADVVDDASFAAITAGTDVTLTAGPTLAVTGAVTAGTDYVLEADAITLGDTAITTLVRQRAGGLVSVHARSGDIAGVGNLELRSNFDDTLDLTGSDVTLQADTGAVNFGTDTAIFAGVEGTANLSPRSDVIVTSQPGITLGDVTANSLYTAGSSGVTGGHDALIAAGAIVTGNVTVDDGLEIYASGATSDITTGALTSNTGDVFVSAERNVAIGLATGAPASNAAGVIGLQAGGTITTGAIVAGDDIAAQAVGTITITSATAGDDIDLLSTAGNVSLGSGSSLASGVFFTSVAFPGSPGSFTGAVPVEVVVGEDSDLTQSTIRLRAPTGDVQSTGTLTTVDGDIILNASRDVSVNNATATGLVSGGSIAVRAGRDVLHNTLGTLTSTSEDVAIGAGRNATLGTLIAADDIDLNAVGTVSWRALQLTRTAETARFVDVVSGTAGATGGVTFTTPDDAALALANVIRIRASGTPGTVPLLPDGLIAGTVNADDLTAQADAGDIHLGTVTAAGDIAVTATQGSVTGLPSLYAPAATGGSISGADTVLLGFTGNASLGAISAGSVRTIGTVPTTDTLRIASVTASDIDLRAVTTLDVGTISGGTVNLLTTGGTAATFAPEIIAPATALAPGFGAANLTSSVADGLISVTALNGVAQLGTLTAGTGTGLGSGIGYQILVQARALTALSAQTLDGSLALIASDGLLSLDTGNAAQHLTLVKRNDDGTSIGSATTTDILKVGDVSGIGGSLTAGYGIDVSSETSLIVNAATAQGGLVTDRDLLVTAAGNMLFNEGTATNGSVGLYAGGTIQGRTALVPGTLTAAQDVTIDAGGTVEFRAITAGDDVDIVSATGDIVLQDVTSTGLGADGTSVRFPGTAGQVGALTVLTGEDLALTGATVRLRAAAGNITAAGAGTIATQGLGEIYANAFGDVALDLVNAAQGSVGLLAGGSASATAITASEDIGIFANGAVTVGPFASGTLTSGDDIDIVGGSITLNGTVTATGLGNGGTSLVTTGAPGTLDAIGIGVEDAQLLDSTIRLRSASFITATPGILQTLARGEVFVNATTDATLADVTATDGSIGILAGGDVTTNTLIASRDIGVRGGVTGTPASLISIASATAGDDIDVVAINGDLTVTTARSNGVAGTGGTSLDLTGTPGAIGAVALTAVEDTQLVDSTIRLRAQTGSVSSTLLRTVGRGEVLVNAGTNATLKQAFAQNGSIGVLAGGLVDVTGAGSVLDASVDVGIQGGTGVTILSAIAGDDIDVVALTGDLALTNGTAKATLGTGGTSLVFGTPGAAAAVGVALGEDAQLGTLSTIRLRAATGDVTSAGVLETQGLGNVLVNAGTDATLKQVFARNGSIGVLAGGLIDVTGAGSVLNASVDVGVQGGTGVTIASAIAGDDIDVVALTGDLTLTSGLSTGTGAGGTSVVFGTPGVAGAVGLAASEDAELQNASIRLRAAGRDVVSTGTLHTQAAGDVLVNAARDASLTSATADAGSIGLLAGRNAQAGTLVASRDIGIAAGTDAFVTIAATAGDDIDVVAGRDVGVLSATSLGIAGAGGSALVLGTAGAVNAVRANGTEDVQLAGSSTIRLRAATGSVFGAGTTPVTGTTLTTAAGNILVNAASDATILKADAVGSIGVLTGAQTTATTLIATRDIGVQGGTGVTIATATAGDDVDALAVTGDLALTNGTSTGAGTNATAVVFSGAAGTAGAVGFGSEDAQLGDATIRLRTAAGNVSSTGTLVTQGAGEVLVNASGNATLATAQATAGSVGVLTGGQATATTLIASRDIGVQGGTGVTITSATAGDDIDVVALTGTLSIDNALSNGTGTNGTSVVFTGAPGTAAAIGIGAEDAQLTDKTIRLRAATGNVASAVKLETQGTGEVLVNANGNATLATAQATVGSIGVLTGGQATATTLIASRDIGVQGGTGVTITSATAGDDIDVVALTGNLAIDNALSNGTGANGTSVVFTGAPGTAAAVGIGAEDAQLTDKTIRLRAATGNAASAVKLETQGTGEVLVNASGNATLATAQATAGSIGVLTGGQATATTLIASRDIGVQGGTGVTITSATAGDDVDVVALTGTLSIDNALSNGTGANGTSVLFTAPAGAVAAVGIGAEDAQLTGQTIRLRAATGNVASAVKLETQGTGEVLVNAGGTVALTAAQALAGSIGVLAGGGVTANTLTASRDIGVQGGTAGTASDVVITSATAGDDIDVVALAGNLAVDTALSDGTGTNGTSVVFAGAPGTVAAVAIGAEDAQLTAQTIRLRAQVGDVTSGTLVSAQGTGDALLNAAGQVLVRDVNANFGSVGILAGTSVTAPSLGAGGDVVVQAGTRIDVGGAFAGDDVDMVALGGNLTVGGGALQSAIVAGGTAGAGGTQIAFTAPAGTVGAVVKNSGDAAQLGGSTVRLRSATGNVVATGKVEAQGTGDVLVNARTNLDLQSATTAKAGSVALLAGGDLTAATTTASEDVAARAGGNATLTTTTAGDDIDIAAANLVTVTTATIGGTASGLDARQAVLVAAQAGQEAGIALNAGDLRGPRSLPTGSTLANTANGRTITIEAANVAIGGNLNAGTGRITLRNTGANATVVGDATITTGNTFAVSDAELGRLKASTVIVDSGARALELGKLTIAADTGSTDTRFLGTDAVEITGAVTVAGTAQRTLQIGGLLGELGETTATETLARSIVARIDRASRPKIDAGSALVELRGDRILFGTTLMVGAYLPLDDTQIALEVSNPRSKLYSDVTAQNLGTFLTAKRVTVGYKNFALFQNTQTSNNVGVLINSPVGGVPDQTALALRLISTGETGTNAFAMFGVVNNFTGTTAAILTNDAVQITSSGGGDFRIKRVASRLNGCIIGAADRGCLATDVPQPNFNFYDERKVALFDVDKDPTIAISPLIGRGNDGLIVNVADAPVGIDTIECRPEDPNCPAKEAK
jgi:filamentous hemagglutinin family protein